MEPIEFDITFTTPVFRGKIERSRIVDMGVTKDNHTDVWNDLSRRQLEFTRDRINAYLDDTAQDNGIVYLMACGHEYDSPYRLSRNSQAYCSQHGFQRLAEGQPGEEFLPEFRDAGKRIRRQ